MELYESTVESLATAMELEPFLRRVPSTYDVPVDGFEDPEVVEASDGSPQAPVERALAFRREATSLRELSSIVTKESAAQVHERIRTADLASLELVLEQDVVDTIQANPEYREPFLRVAAAEQVTVFVHEGPFPFLLALDEDRVALCVTTEDGFPATLVVAESSQVYDWAESVFERFWSEGTPFAERDAPLDSTESVDPDMPQH